MDALVEEPEWTAFFHCHEALSDGSWSVERDYGRLTLPLQILALADTGKAVAALDRVWELAGQSSLRPGWLLLGQALTRGRQPMGLWVRLIANLNIRLAGDADITSWRRFWDWKGSLSLNALNRVSDTEWVFRVLDKDFLPLFLAGVAARGQTLLRWHVRRLLALVLLQQSLGGRSDLLESLDCLPARGRFWDDCPPPVAP